jgi:hypothetical protein
MVEKALKGDEIACVESSLAELIYHRPCYDSHMEAERDKRPVEVTQGLLDYLNNCRLLVEADLSKSIEDNQAEAEGALDSIRRRRWMHEKSIDEIFVSLRKLQATTACMSILLNDKQKKEVSLRISTEEKRRSALAAKVGEAQDYRESEQRKVERKREKQTPEGKAIAQLMKTFGWTEDVARTHLQSMKSEGGSIQ